MFKVETKKVSRKVITNVICNRCGNGCKGKSKMNYEHAHVSVCWGYESNNKDGERHDWDLCDRCYDVVVKAFKYPPTITDYLHGDKYPDCTIQYPPLDWDRDAGQETKK